MEFTTIEELLETMGRGNEVVFEYQNCQYSCTPWWENNRVIGCVWGISNQDNYDYIRFECFSRYCICGQKMEKIFKELHVVDRVI